MTPALRRERQIGATEQVPGQAGLHRQTLPQTNKPPPKKADCETNTRSRKRRALEIYKGKYGKRKDQEKNMYVQTVPKQNKNPKRFNSNVEERRSNT